MAVAPKVIVTLLMCVTGRKASIKTNAILPFVEVIKHDLIPWSPRSKLLPACLWGQKGRAFLPPNN